ncbi:serine hydrolase domain-containing protein [Bacillus sp. PS06]|uniref:serine hydrolase domain-containing protein n=1 Tax=Bacillus sp. PS06 TaxID=2764176 RepID=UPI0017829081|nr:serine hydrolase domain-containing protein [Bacillus sp. PS06]MBD8068744.1 beta-lactamase family protein [Bacillus sp. PS06]
MNGQVTMSAFETYAEELIQKYQIPGTAIGFAHNGEVVYEKGFGYRNIEKQLPVTMDTVYGIASVTKSFTCVAIMILQEQGKLSVHDPVVKYLPEFSTPTDATDKMTIHHFMTHSAGIPPLPSLIYAKKRSLDIDPSAQDYPGLQIVKDDQQPPIDTYEQLMEFIAGLDFDLLGEPGTEFSYSNDCYALLGTIVQRVSGISFEQFVKDYILDPCGMEHSCFVIEELGDYENITSLYAARKVEAGMEVYEAPVWWESPSMRGAGALKSTVNDMLKYAEIIRTKGMVGDKRILTEESVEQMITPYIECSPGRFYGYGFMITPDYHGATLVEHGGNLKAIASQLCIIPERGVTGMILTNLAGVPATTIMSGALNDLEGRPVEATPYSTEEYEMSSEQLRDYEGIYASNEGMGLKIDVIDDGLEFSSHGTSFPIQCVGQDLFLAIVKDQKELIRFVRDESGEIERVAYHMRQFPKIK